MESILTALLSSAALTAVFMKLFNIMIERRIIL